MSLFFILFCPLIGALLSYGVGKKSPHLAGIIATIASTLSFVFVLYFFRTLNANDLTPIEETLFTWLKTDNWTVDFALRFDALSAVMCLFVTGVGSLIHLYSIGYMAKDDSQPRFFAYLNLFLFAMLMLVLGANLLVMFIGWEGVGLCSYLLIGFWFKNIAFASAGRKAFVVNRIGDVGFLLGAFLLLYHFHTLSFSELEGLTKTISITPVVLTVIALCLFTGAVGKSAQIPLFVWLPDAMAGPTPVSALIHAATMVTAGIYLLARSHFIFDLTPIAGFVVATIALLTAFVAASIALVQNDIKKVLAYSTVSQLGFMFLAASAGFYSTALFHVVTHSFFKACLFLGAGSVILACHHEQDMRKLGGLARKLPVTFITYAAATLSIAGIFPFAGYQSKHAIFSALEHTTNPYIASRIDLFMLVIKISAILTAFYMTRSVVMTFFGESKAHGEVKESARTMTIPLVVLGILSLLGGMILEPHFGTYLSGVLGNPLPHEESGLISGVLGSWTGILGVGLGLLLYVRFTEIPGIFYKACGPFGKLLTRKYYLDEIYGVVIIRPLEQLAKMLFANVDRDVIDASVNGSAAVVEGSGKVLRFFHTGRVNHYAFMMLIGVLLVFVYCAML